MAAHIGASDPHKENLINLVVMVMQHPHRDNLINLVVNVKQHPPGTT